MPGAAPQQRQAALLELFGHAAQPTGLLDAWGGRSLVEQMERGALTSRQFYEAVVEASGGWLLRGGSSVPAPLSDPVVGA